MYIFRNRQCSGYFSVLKRYNDICNHVEILHCSVKEMQLQFSKNKPTRIGMQFLFYQSLYAVGIIANFNKTLGNHSCLMHLIWKLFVKWALNCGKCNKECKSWHRLYWKFRIYFYSYRLSSMRVIIILPSLASSRT